MDPEEQEPEFETSNNGFFGTIVLALVLAMLAGLVFLSTTAKPSLPAIPADPLSALIQGAQSDLVTTRPVHDGQLDLKDLYPGEYVYEMGKIRPTGKDYKFETLILSAPYEKDGDCRFDAIWWDGDKPIGKFIQSSYCADEGLVEYTGQLQGWNPNNYLLKSERQPLTQKELDDLKSTLKPEPEFNPNQIQPAPGQQS